MSITRHFARIGVYAGLAIVCFGLASCSMSGHKDKMASGAEPVVAKDTAPAKDKPAEQAEPAQAKEKAHHWYQFAWLPFVGHKDKPAASAEPAKDASAAKGKPAAVVEPAAVQEAPTAKDYEAVLAKTVRAAIQATDNVSEEQRDKVLHHKPYYYREYSVYTDGPDSFKILIQEKEQKSAPYIADVTIPKQRFATRLHRKRGDAGTDTNFLRDTGTETITYEVRNGRWVRVASIFVADKSEEKINGEWIPVKETVKRTLPGEEENSKGFLKRTWSKFFGY